MGVPFRDEGRSLEVGPGTPVTRPTPPHPRTPPVSPGPLFQSGLGFRGTSVVSSSTYWETPDLRSCSGRRTVGPGHRGTWPRRNTVVQDIPSHVTEWGHSRDPHASVYPSGPGADPTRPQGSGDRTLRVDGDGPDGGVQNVCYRERVAGALGCEETSEVGGKSPTSGRDMEFTHTGRIDKVRRGKKKFNCSGKSGRVRGGPGGEVVGVRQDESSVSISRRTSFSWDSPGTSLSSSTGRPISHGRSGPPRDEREGQRGRGRGNKPRRTVHVRIL